MVHFDYVLDVYKIGNRRQEQFVENLFCQTEEEELPKDDTSAINKVLGVHVISKFLGSVGMLCQNNAL